MSKYERVSTHADWLIDAAAIPTNCWMTVPGSRVLETDAQAALDAQYGSNVYKAWRHGNCLHVSRRGERMGTDNVWWPKISSER